MLQATHFMSTTGFGSGGIQFDYRITRAERDLFNSADAASGDEARETRVVINPHSPTLSQLRVLMEVNCGLRDMEVYDTKWNYDEKAEGQQLVAVAYDGDAPVGYASFRIDVDRAPAEKRIHYIASLGSVYVDARHRRRGFGVDLSCAMGMVCAEVLHALLRAAPQECQICLTMTSEMVGKSGVAIARSVRDTIELGREMADDPRCQDEIIFEAA